MIVRRVTGVVIDFSADQPLLILEFMRLAEMPNFFAHSGTVRVSPFMVIILESLRVNGRRFLFCSDHVAHRQFSGQ